MATTLKYSLEDFRNIRFEGFNFVLPEDTITLISNLSLEVGSPTYIKTPNFQKQDNSKITTGESSLYKTNNRRRNKPREMINDEEWESVRNFQSTKIEQKEGVEIKINDIKLLLNKITDKNYSENKDKIIAIMTENNEYDELFKIGTTIFEIASNNKFYSKIYADLYTEIMGKFEIMKDIFEKSISEFLELFDVIQYVDPNVDYNLFCKINLDNERRQSLSLFFVNLMINGVIKKERILNIVQNLLTQVKTYISKENKKNEVDELTENISILYKKELFDEDDFNNSELQINGMKLNDFIDVLANSKVKNYLSFTNKSLFKFMDMVEM
uniref:MIF4G domain-containing protein n=1 Tax=viral metagenome TaxID=1070528 RepID=A0A6C0IGY2_9ZZZZ